MTWKKEALRDLESLGSFVFYFIVASRSLIGRDWSFLVQMGIALVISLILWQSVKYLTDIKASSHASNLVILLILVSAFYKELLFSIFLLVVFSLVCYAHTQLRKHKKYELIVGTLIGFVAGGIVWWALG